MMNSLIIGRKYTAKTKAPPRNRKNLGKFVKANNRYHWFERGNASHGENMKNYYALEENTNPNILAERGVPASEQNLTRPEDLQDHYLYYAKMKFPNYIRPSFIGRYNKKPNDIRTKKLAFYIEKEGREVTVDPASYTFYRQYDPSIGFYHGNKPPNTPDYYAPNAPRRSRTTRRRKTLKRGRKA